MKQRAMMLVVLLLAMTMVLSACDGVVSGGLLQKLLFELGNDLNDNPEELSQLIETIPEDFTIPEEVTEMISEELTLTDTTEPDTTEPATTEPELVPSQGLEFKSNGNGTCTVAKIGTCTDTNIVIPSVSPYGDRVTSIGDSAFRSYSGLTSIVIPDGVTSIGDSAFSGCRSLTSIVIPNGVTSIGEAAFAVCISLTSIVIPDGVTSIGNSVFWDCSGLTSIVIPDGVTSIGDNAFEGCESLTSVVIPDGVTSIGDYAFSGCSGLTSVVIPDSVTSIDTYAFTGCESLTDVYYTGTEQEWAAISGGTNNDDLKGATIHFNYVP